MGEVTKRRGRVLGMNPDDDGLQVVEAEVPVAEMQDFTTFLRQLTQGRGYFTFEFVRYETLPQMLENKVIEQAKALATLRMRIKREMFFLCKERTKEILNK